MIARWPGKIAAGTQSEHPSAFWDYLPTACEVAGLAVDRAAMPSVDGISYLPTLLGNGRAQKKHEYLFWASSEGATSVGVRQGNWKLVKYRTAKKKPATGQDSDDWRLYDLSTDVGEERDISGEYPAKVAEIIGLLKRDQLAH